ncbi:MAG: PfkB family carbohydrate kinase [Gaiellaceae bacterium]
MPLDIIQSGSAVWQRAGGTAGNVAAILALLGWKSALAGRIGDDRAGISLRSDLEGSSVDCSLLDTDESGLTNRLVHQVRSSGHRYLFTCPHCGQRLPRSRPLRLDQVDGIVEAYPSPDIYFFDRANPATVLLAERYAELAATVVFEPSTPASAELVQRAIHAASIVKGSHEHGPELVESFESGRADQLRVITEGIRGARVRIGARAWHRVGVFDAELVDAAGAGDWTTAGMLHTIIGQGRLTLAAVREGITYGHALAALNCALPGARGLAEGRTRANIQTMVRNLRRGRRVVPDGRTPKAARAKARACSWCLLDLEAGRSLRVASG